MGRNTEAQATGRVLSAITRCKRHIPIVLIAAIVAAVFSRTLFLGQVLYRGDIEAATMPWFAFLSHERQAGQWLPWCTGVGCGFPLWANMNTGAFYLPNLLGILRIAPAWTLAFLLALHYFWAALGMYVLGRRFRLGTLGSFSAGIVYALTGFMVAHQIHYNLICAASWLPWFAVGTMLWALRRSVAGLVLASISLASAWLNHPQSPVFIVAFGLACTSVAVLVMRQREGSVCRQVLPSLAVAMLPVAVGTLLGGVVLWPAYELVRAGCGEARSGYEFMTSFSLPPRQLVTFLLPDFWGGPWDYSGAWNHWETCGYAGGICLLVTAAVAIWLRNKRGLYWALVALALVALLLAFGGYTPLYRALQYVPVLNRFRCPGRWLLLWSGSMALLGGLAVHEFAEVLRTRNASRWLGWLFTVVAICGGAISALTLLDEDAARLYTGTILNMLRGGGWHRYVLSEEGYQRLRFIGIDLAWLSACATPVAVVVWLARREVVNVRWAPRVLAMVLVVQGFGFAWQYATPASPQHYRLQCRLQRLLPASIRSGRMAQYYENPAPSDLHLVQPNANLLFGIPLTGIYDPLTPPAQRLLTRLGKRVVRDPGAAASLGVSTVLTDVPPRWAGLRASLIGRVPCARGGRPVYVYRNKLYRGLAWTVSRVTDEARVRQAIRAQEAPVGFILDAPSITPEPSWVHTPLTGNQHREVEVMAWNGHRILVRVPPGPACSLVVSSARLPGWTARINGVQVPLATANGVFCSVELPSDECHVELTYAPSGLGQGLMLALCGVSLGALAAVAARRRPST